MSDTTSLRELIDQLTSLAHSINSHAQVKGDVFDHWGDDVVAIRDMLVARSEAQGDAYAERLRADIMADKTLSMPPADRAPGERPSAEWYRRKITKTGDSEPPYAGAALATGYKCSNPVCGILNPQGHCPACVKDGRGWSSSAQGEVAREYAQAALTNLDDVAEAVASARRAVNATLRHITSVKGEVVAYMHYAALAALKANPQEAQAAYGERRGRNDIALYTGAQEDGNADG